MSIAPGFIGTNTLDELRQEREPDYKAYRKAGGGFAYSLLRADNDLHRQLLRARKEIATIKSIHESLARTREAQEEILSHKGCRFPYA